MKICITGGNGLVGSALTTLLAPRFQIVAPDRNSFNIIDRHQVHSYLSDQKPDFIIHAAAYVNAGEAEKDRGNKQGLCYQTNVEGTRILIEEGKKVSIPVIYISTGSVFHGTEKSPGPFTETDVPIKNAKNNNWYGYTKYLGEKTGPEVIIRISHPVIPDDLRVKDDYLHKILHGYETRSLFPLFTDQLFPLTYIGDLSYAIETILLHRYTGVFHVASPDVVSPYEMAVYMLNYLHKPIDERIKKLLIDEFHAQGNSQLRFAKYCAVSSLATQRKLGIQFLSWKNILEESLTTIDLQKLH